ncbi:uncharacterized protein LOC119741081 isoform X2 [Patiria miniata]|uniref:Uncharacterized protein n=1 Tax=Patiria miniata TaxID=46514 RepID=A0A914B9J7_PATMI|nr:uncharacterized protein LOC119741081 isoform X2 [Patiria miniata]
MDHSSHGDDDNDSAIVPRPTGQLSFKKVKRTRVRVDHLSDEEKRWRKRILGRERARRYRERKRASESSPEELSDACVQMEAPPPLPRGRGRPKGSRTKKRRLILLTPQSKNFERGASEERKLPAIEYARYISPSSVSLKEADDQGKHEEASCSWTLRDTSSRSLIIENPTSLTERNVGTCTSTKTEISPFTQQTGVTVIEGTLQDNTIMLRGRVCENIPDEAEESLVEDQLSLDDPNQHLISLQMEAGVKKLDLQAPSIHGDDSPGIVEDPKNTDLTGKSFNASNIYSTDVKNLSKNCDQKGQWQRRRRRFKQQNVRDFINFFPIDDLGCTDSKSFVSGSCSLQRQVEYVPSGKRSYASKQSACETSTKPSTSSDVINVESLGNVSQKDGEFDSIKSKDVVEDAFSREKSAEKLTGAPSVESVSTPLAAPTSQAALGSAQLSGNLAAPVVYESPSTQPSALVGLNLSQTLQDVQISGLLQQQQLINAAANIQGLNTVSVSGQANIVAAQKTSDGKGVPSLQGIAGLPKLEGLTGVQGLAGIQSIVGSSTLQGLQGVTDPRFLPVAGLQGVSGIQNIASLQGVVGGLPGLSGLQGLTSLQGFGCLPGITGPTSPAGLVGLQGIPNLQAVQAFQGIPSFQPTTGLQGLVTLQGITGLPGIQGLQGVGIAGLQSAQGLQAVTTLQGGAYLPGITGLQGVSGLISGLPSQAGVSGQQEPPTATSAALTEGTANQKEDMGQGVKEQGEERTTDLSRAQHCQPGEGNAEDESLRSGTSGCQEPEDAQTRSVDVAASTQEKMRHLQKGRSRRKQASPRCITKHFEFTSRDMNDTGKEQRSCRSALFAEDAPPDDSGQSGSTSFSANMPLESKRLDPVTASTPQKDSSLMKPQARDRVESPRPGAKLSKKVEELMSATHPHRRLNVDCSSPGPVDDESPSPQTWRRFLEREKQRHDRLKEVEEQLARLQSHADRCQAFSPKSFVSTSTQTEPGGVLGNQDGRIDPTLHGSTATGQGGQTTSRQTEGSGVTCGQIQQGVVTSSGDSLFANPSPEANRSEDEVPDTAPSVAEDAPVSQDEVPPDTGQDTEAKIKNSPRTIWLHSGKRKRKASRRSIRSLISPFAEGSNAESGNPLNQEATEASRALKSPLSSSPQKKTAKFVFQIPLDDLDTSDNTGQVDEAHEFSSDNGLDNKFEVPLSGSVGDSVPSVSFVDQSNAEVPCQPHSVLPWEVEGLSKIERNRIRAREGMRRHREKLRQAKLAAQTLMCRSVLPDSQLLLEASPVIWGSGALDTPGPVSLKTPVAFNGGKIEVVEGANRTCISPAKVTAHPALANTEVIESTSQVPGSKKPFDVLAQVAVKIEPSEIKHQETMDLPSTQRTEEPKAKIKTIASQVGTEVQISNNPETETPLPRKISKTKPVKFEQGSPSNLARIDFTQEPYKSMNLRDRNRVRAREGMRRYRERMRLAQLAPLQPQKVSFGMPRCKGGSPKSSPGKSNHQGSTKCDDSVAASKQLAELAKQHTNESSPAVSYSEFIEHGKAEVMKRKRAFSLLRMGSGRPKRKLIGKHLPLPQVSKSNRLQDDASSGSRPATLKSGHIALLPKEFNPDADSKRTTEDPERGCLNPMFTKQKKRLKNSQPSSAEHPKRPATISTEVLNDAEKNSSKSEGMTENPFDLALRKKVIQEKMLCGMDKYAAISSAAAAQRHAKDLAVVASHREEEQEEQEQPVADEDLYH